MKYEYKIFSLLFVLGFLGCNNKPDSIGDISKEEYEVYSIVIDSLYKNHSQSIYIIADSTDRNHYKLDIRYFKNGEWIESKELDGLHYRDSSLFNSDYEELSSNFQLKNEKYYQINSKLLNTTVHINQITTDSLDKIFSFESSKDWTLFYKIFPNSDGLISLSRVGFNTKNNIAVLYHSRIKGSLYGEGVYILLHKINSKWQIKKIQRDWIS